MKRNIWITLALITLGFAVLILGPHILALIPLALVIAAGWLVFSFVKSVVSSMKYVTKLEQCTPIYADKAARKAARRRRNQAIGADDKDFQRTFWPDSYY